MGNNRESKERIVIRYKVLQEIIRALNSTLDLNMLCNLLLDFVMDLMGAECGSIMIFDEESGCLKIQSGRGIKDDIIKKTRVRPGEGICGKVFESGEPVVVDNITKDDRFKPTKRKRYKDNSFISLPLNIAGKTMGIINLNNYTLDKEKRAEQIEILKEIIESAAIAIQNAILIEKLKRTKEQVEAVIENVSCGIIVIDEEYNIKEINSCAYKILSMDKEFDNILKLDKARYIEFINIIVESKGKEVIKEEIEISDRENNKKVLSININHMSYRDFKRVLIFFEDITSIKKIKTEFERESRVSFLYEKLASVTHEIRNPLSLISGFIQLIEENIDNKETIKNNIKIVNKEIERLNRLLQDLLYFSKPIILNPEYVNTREITTHIINFFKEDAIVKNIDIICRTDTIKNIFIDKDRILQVIYNLIQNSLDATSRGNIEVNFKTSFSDRLEISVRDTGEGFEEATKERIFEPFFTTKKSGTGLGLYVCKKIIDAMGGEIKIISEKGKGTEVNIVIPVIEIMG
ncbi:MAG: ATP-binding protein [Candidatus Hydrogenedentota bacterium]